MEVDPNHSKAIHCKIVCLIQLNEFEEALKYIENQNEEIRKNFHLEQAYCQYRLNNVEESLKCLNGKDVSDDLGANELKAQTLYRIENFDDCYSSYVDLIKNSNDDYEDERMVNLAAVIVGLKNINSNIKYDLASISNSTYEVIYNKACALVAIEQYTKAIAKLQDAEMVCKKFLEDDGATEEEIQSELAIIHAQIAYCNQRMGKTDQALKTYNEILKQKLSDPALIAVISNNIVAIHRDQNLFDSKKKIRMALSENAESKMSSNQKVNIHYNYCLFMINTHQYDLCHKHLPIFRSKFPNNEADAVLIEAYLYIKEKNQSKAIDTLKNYCLSCKNPTVIDLEAALFLTELLLKQNDLDGCAKVLENLGEFRFSKLAIVSILLQIYEKTMKIEEAEKLFDHCIDWHEKHKV